MQNEEPLGSPAPAEAIVAPTRTGHVARYATGAPGAGCGASTVGVVSALGAACYASSHGPTVAAEDAACSAYRLGAEASGFQLRMLILQKLTHLQL